MSLFLLVDINSYFATIAQQENPFLRDKPVVVVKDLGRTCVIAASKEAKKLGIKTGDNLHQLKRIFPNIIEVPADFEMYLSATKKLKKIFEQISPDVQVYSLDEAFIDISGCTNYLYKDYRQLGRHIQEIIKKQLGDWVTANVGIGKNRFLAKLAAEIADKGSVLEINSDNKDIILATASFNDICGIGYRLSMKLAKLGIYCPYQIRFYTQADLESWFGPFWARELLKMAYGEEPHHLSLLGNLEFAQQDPKSISRSITLRNTISDLIEIKKILFNLSREVIYKSRKMGLVGRHLSLVLIGSDNNFWKKNITFKNPVSHTHEMMGVFNQWLKEEWKNYFSPIKFMVALSLTSLVTETLTPLLPSWHKYEAIEKAIDEIDNKYGLYTVRSGLLHQSSKLIQPEVTGFLGDKNYQFNHR